MSTWIVLVIAIFMNATDPPETYSFVMLPGVACNKEAAEYAVSIVVDDPNKIAGFNYSCDTAHGPDGPAKKHVPGRDEA